MNASLIMEHIHLSTPFFTFNLSNRQNYLNKMFTSYYKLDALMMDDTNESKQKRRSGVAEILYNDEWEEVLRTRGKEKDQRYVVPENGGVIGIRFAPEDAGKVLRIFKETK
jgi:hypothetical protein